MCPDPNLYGPKMDTVVILRYVQLISAALAVDGFLCPATKWLALLPAC
jgi:hypothetical protein